MTATQQKWAERIAAWRESGLTSEKFCEGRDFSANGLRHWAYKLGQTKQRRPKATVPIARVVRAAAAAPTAAEAITSTPLAIDGSLTVEINGARASSCGRDSIARR